MFTYREEVERWGIQEIVISGYDKGNPYIERNLKGYFSSRDEQVETEGFYDGDGIYRIRFMPSFDGEYQFRLEGNCCGNMPLPGGSFRVQPASPGNHGPVHTANRFHFAYEDGSPYYCVGTTCYVWDLQSDRLIAQTLNSLKNSPFNKIRFCILPKHYDFNLREPRSYPFPGKPMDSSVLTRKNFNEYTDRTEGNEFDFERFHPEHFRHIEYCILELQKLGIEADLIVMHPYDRWGFAQMTREQDERYWKYVIARFSAFRNVWWSLANEYDLLKHKTFSDWEYFGRLIQEHDPYHRLTSIHNCKGFYDYHRPWITHCSCQRQDVYMTAELTDTWRETYGKPVVVDEMCYEGNIHRGWGNITAQEMVRRSWECVCRGGYPGHGETYLYEEQPANQREEGIFDASGSEEQQILWWSHGGLLRGESWKRLEFLLEIMKDTPGVGLRYAPEYGWENVTAVPQQEFMAGPKSYYLFYFSFMQPSYRVIHIDDTTDYHVYVLDTWEMTKTDYGVFRGEFTVKLPGKPYMAIQMVKEQ